VVPIPWYISRVGMVQAHSAPRNAHPSSSDAARRVKWPVPNWQPLDLVYIEKGISPSD
jgi:hypothetical protein